jgi:hypothetical protein
VFLRYLLKLTYNKKIVMENKDTKKDVNPSLDKFLNAEDKIKI